MIYEFFEKMYVTVERYYDVEISEYVLDEQDERIFILFINDLALHE